MNRSIRLKTGTFSAIKYTILIIATLSIILPLWLMFVSAFRQTTNILTYPPTLWPTDGNFDNFIEIFTMQSGIFFNWIANSVFVGLINTLMVLVLSTCTGYAFAKKSFYGKGFLFIMVLATQMIPSVATLIPQYLIVSKFGWINSYPGLIIPTTASAFGVFLMTQFMKDIPDELLDASKIDGCGEYGTFLRIILPAVLPSATLLAIFNFTQQWGSLTWPLIIVSENAMRTLPLGIASMKDLGSNVSGEIMAASLVSFLPVLLAFLCARKQFMAGMMVGAVKG